MGVRIFILLLAIHVGVFAQAPIYRCQNKEYTNNAADAKARGCAEVVGSSAPSGWDKVARSSDTTVYLHSASIAPSGKHIKAWTLWSFDAPQKLEAISFQSTKEISLYDCAERSIALRSVSYFGGQFPTGSAIETFTKSEEKVNFKEVAPDSIGATLLNSVCAKRK